MVTTANFTIKTILAVSLSNAIKLLLSCSMPPTTAPNVLAGTWSFVFVMANINPSTPKTSAIQHTVASKNNDVGDTVCCLFFGVSPKRPESDSFCG